MQRGASPEYMTSDPIEQFRRMTTAEQIKEGEDSLLSHILEKSIEAREKYPSLGMDNLDTFLGDTDCLRYPTRYVFEFGADMAPHQFAQPEEDVRSEDPNARVIYLRPNLRNRPDYAVLAIAYMVPTVNYGEVATDEHCLVFAASLLGKSEDECYEALCELADFCGSDIKYKEGSDSRSADTCGGGCSC